jgi:hypothetical protein
MLLIDQTQRDKKKVLFSPMLSSIMHRGGTLFAMLYFGLTIIFIVISGFFYPILPIDATTDSMQRTTILILAAFTYPGQLDRFWIICSFNIGLSTLIGSILYWRKDDRLISTMKNIVFIEFFLWFFFWTFYMKYSTINYSLIQDLLMLTAGIFFGLLTGVVFFFHILTNSRKKAKIIQPPAETETLIIVECPHCHRKYESSVRFCISCGKSISPE